MFESKFLGGLVGSALGDCIGEMAFDYAGEELLKMIAEIPLLIYTDDTAMAIGLAESIIAKKGKIDHEHLGTTFRTNYLREPFRGYAIGPPTIFKMVGMGISYPEAARRMFGGTGSYGNGAAMRIAPVGLFFYDSNDLYNEARNSAIVTHAHPLGYEGAALLAKALSLVVKKSPQKKEWTTFIEELYNFVQTEEYKHQIHQIDKLLSEDASLIVAAKKLGTNVTALQSVPFSIFAFLKDPYSYEKCLWDTVQIPGDRDTIGAMVGGLLGSYLGIESIPMKWRKKLENRQTIEELTNKLIELKNQLSLDL